MSQCHQHDMSSHKELVRLVSEEMKTANLPERHVYNSQCRQTQLEAMVWSCNWINASIFSTASKLSKQLQHGYPLSACLVSRILVLHHVQPLELSVSTSRCRPAAPLVRALLPRLTQTPRPRRWSPRPLPYLRIPRPLQEPQGSFEKVAHWKGRPNG